MNNSTRYQNIKSFFKALLDDVNSPYKKYFDAFMIFLIVLSTSLVIIDKTGELPPWVLYLDFYFVTTVFTLEYLLRFWVNHDIHKVILSRDKEGKSKYWLIVKLKLRYMISLPALIDFIAIFPKFRIIRLLKLYHYMSGASSLFDALIKKRFEFIFLGYMLFGVTFTFGSIFYLLEFGINDKLNSYLDAIYWALVTLSTVGYGDISPVTEMGKVVAMFGIIFGIAMISFVTSIMVSAFTERFDKLRNEDSINHVNRLEKVVIINGYGHLGTTVAKKLKKQQVYEPVIIENNESKVSRATEDGYKVIHADGSSAKLISTLCQGDNISAMLTLTSSDINNIYFILNAKSVHAKPIVYARMNHQALHAQYTATKVDGIVEPYAVVDDKTFKYLQKYSKEEEKSITFFGYTHKSSHICKRLKEDGIEVVIYERDEERFEKAKAEGFEGVTFLSNEQHLLPVLENTIAVCAMNEEAINVYYSITLRANAFKDKIVALSDSKEDNRKLFLAGVSKIFDMYEESANQFITMLETYEYEMHNKGDSV